jgi:hypothetical protein
MYQTLKGKVRRGQVEIAEKITLPENAIVLVTVMEEIPRRAPFDWQSELDAIHTRLKASGHKQPTAQDVASYLLGERDSWN